MTRITSLLLLFGLVAACGNREPIGKSRLAKGEGLEVKKFEFLERSGRPLGLDDLKGKVWIGTIIFTRCKTSCIPMCGEMAKLQDEFADEPDFRIVAATCDPAHDTPEVLSSFAKGYGASPDRWYFLTGKREDLHRFAVECLKIAWNEDEPLVHSIDFALVDRQGEIRDYFRLTNPGEMDRMRAVIRQVLAEKKTP